MKKSKFTEVQIVIDDYNREMLAMQADLSLPALRVIRVLEFLLEFRGYPKWSAWKTVRSSSPTRLTSGVSEILKEELHINVPDELNHAIYQNHFITKRTLYQEYIQLCLDPVIQFMRQQPVLSMMFS